MKKDILNIENLVAGYTGESESVLKGINLSMGQAEIYSLIGEEGSGKSTLVKAITRQIPTTGVICYQGRDLSSVRTDEMIRCGIDFIIQGGNILRQFTVEEHVQLALQGNKKKQESKILWQEIESTFPQVAKLRKQVAGRLSGGERMLLSLSCLMTSNADLWVLDEPTAGLAPEMCTFIFNFLIRMKLDRQKTILIMEHNYDFAFDVCDSLLILKEGNLSCKYFPDQLVKKDFLDKLFYGQTKSTY